MTMDKVLLALYEREGAYRAELELKCPDWYNPHDYASGHWQGRSGVLKRELAWIESLIDEIQESQSKPVIKSISPEDMVLWAERN